MYIYRHCPASWNLIREKINWETAWNRRAALRTSAPRRRGRMSGLGPRRDWPWCWVPSPVPCPLGWHRLLGSSRRLWRGGKFGGAPAGPRGLSPPPRWHLCRWRWHRAGCCCPAVPARRAHAHAWTCTRVHRHVRGCGSCGVRSTHPRAAAGQQPRRGEWSPLLAEPPPGSPVAPAAARGGRSGTR